MFFSPIRDYQTTSLDAKRSTNIGALFGGGVAYELSPSFDIRVEYRGIRGEGSELRPGQLQDEPYEVISMPALGVAYHF